MFQKNKTPEPIPVDEAFAQLPGPSFAVWMRLHTVPTARLNLGIRALARDIHIGRTRLQRALADLRRRGYVRYQDPGPPQVSRTINAPSQVQLTRQAKIPPISRYIRS